jgi:hypothetical protein
MAVATSSTARASAHMPLMLKSSKLSRRPAASSTVAVQARATSAVRAASFTAGETPRQGGGVKRARHDGMGARVRTAREGLLHSKGARPRDWRKRGILAAREKHPQPVHRARGAACHRGNVRLRRRGRRSVSARAQHGGRCARLAHRHAAAVQPGAQHHACCAHASCGAAQLHAVEDVALRLCAVSRQALPSA